MLIVVRKRSKEYLRSFQLISQSSVILSSGTSVEIRDVYEKLGRWQPPTPCLRTSSEYCFNLLTYFGSLDTKYFGQFIIYKHVLETTQNLVKALSSDLPNGAVCVCDKQLYGKGRGQNEWQGPPGSLLFTFKDVIPMNKGQLLPLFQYVACLAVVKSLKKLVDIDVKIKWPNDIYVKEISGEYLKVGGILCESTSCSEGFVVFVGIGLNVDNSTPTVCINDLVESNEKCDREKILALYFNFYEEMVTILLKEGFERLRKEYLENWLHSGQKIRLASENNIEVVVKSISMSTGALIAEATNGDRFELVPDGNSFNFFEGLICRKI